MNLQKYKKSYIFVQFYETATYPSPVSVIRFVKEWAGRRDARPIPDDFDYLSGTRRRVIHAAGTEVDQLFAANSLYLSYLS